MTPTGHIKSVGILGAGKLGTVVARLAIGAGYTVYIAGSGNPEKIQLSMKFIAPGAMASTSKYVVATSDVIILAMPLSKFRNVNATSLNKKLVIDAMNYWWEVDGNDSEFKNPTTSTSEIVQSYFKGARVIKALSHMGYHHLFDESKPRGSKGRKAIAIAGDNPKDNHEVAHLIDDLGFDPVIIGDLHRGKILEPGSPLFGANIDKKELQQIVKTLL